MQQRINIHNFQESLGLSGIKGLNGRVVEPWSASIGDPGRERSKTINSDHMDMCRYSGRDDPGYVKVGSYISSQVEDLRKHRVDEMAQEYNDTLTSLCGEVTVGMLSHVSDPDPATFRWLPHDPRLCSWIEDQHGLFAIKAHASDVIKAHFFFNEQGLPQDTSYTGMLRGLLYDLFDRYIEVYDSILEEIKFEGSRSRTKRSLDWTPKLLRNLLFLVAQRAKGKTIIIFVDALDECMEQDRPNAIKFLYDWHRNAQSFGITLNVCISSRPDTSIDMDLSEVLAGSVLLQNENYRDISIYVNKSLGSRDDPRRKKNYYANFAAKVAEKADGVFLWVILVIPTLRTAITRGKTEAELNLLLEEIPPQLKDLYTGILKKIDEDCLQDTMRMLQLAAVAKRPFSVKEFRHAVAFGTNSQYESLADWEASSEFIEDDFMVQCRIQSISGGLLEVCKAPDDRQNISMRKRDEFRNYHDRSSNVRNSLFPGGKGDSESDGMEETDKTARNAIDSMLYTPSPSSEPDMFLPESDATDFLGSRRYTSLNSYDDSSDADGHRYGVAAESSSKNASFLKPARDWEWNDTQFIRSHKHRHIYHKDANAAQVVRLIHETAKHFFVKGEGFPILYNLIRSNATKRSLQDIRIFNPFTSQDGSYIVGGYQHMVRTAFNYLDLDEIRPSIKNLLMHREIPTGHSTRLPLLRYVSEHWLTHVSEADNEIGSQRWVMEKLISYTPACIDDYVCWAAAYNILSWIDVAEELHIDVDIPALAYGRPIMEAVHNGHLGMVVRLKEAGANVNGVTGGSKTALRLAERLNNKAMVELLKSLGGTMEQVHYLPPEGTLVRLNTAEYARQWKEPAQHVQEWSYVH